MTHQAPPSPALPGADPGRQIAQLREAMRLVERIAGRPATTGRDARLDEAARISDAYDRALPIARRRFEARAAEAAIWAAAGVEALLAAGERAPRAAAERLAESLERSLNELAETLSP
jgi:hypothetical protein